MTTKLKRGVMRKFGLQLTLLSLAVSGWLIVTIPAAAQTIQPPFEADYTLVDLGPVPGLPPSHGGLTFLAGDPNTILIDGSANKASGKLYSIGVVQDADNYITGFTEMVVLGPLTATNASGTDHTVTATATLGDSPVEGAVVTFKVLAGPNLGDLGTAPTNADGSASFTYTGDGGMGTDEIQASFVTTSRVTVSSNIVTKRWVTRVGDVNGNGILDAEDAVLILQVLVGLNPPEAVNFSAGDMNADGTINNLDSVLILGTVAGRIPPLPDNILITVLDNGDGTILAVGSTGAVPPDSTVNLANETNGAVVSVTAESDGSFSEVIAAVDGENTIVADVDGGPARIAIPVVVTVPDTGIRGLVTASATGTPVVGLTVQAYDFDSGAFITQTLTSATGTYLLVVPAGDYTVVALGTGQLATQWSGGAANSDAAVPVTVGSITDNVDFALAAGGALAGQVTDPDGTPAEGQLVVFLDAATGDFVAVDRTEADGSFTRGLVPGRYKVRIDGEASGFATVYFDKAPVTSAATPVEVTAGTTTSGVNVQLTQGGRMLGRVTASDGTPLPQASMSAVDAATGAFVASASANFDGMYRIPLPAGSYKVWVDPRGRPLPQQWFQDQGIPIYTRSSASVVTVGTGEEVTVDISVASGGSISGRIRSLKDDAPVSAVRVAIFGETTGAFGDARVRADGTYTAYGPPDDYRVEAQTSNDTPFVRDFDDRPDFLSADLVPITGVGIDTPNIDFVLAANFVSTGRRLFFARDIVGADEFFQAELAIDPTNQEAHLFRAATRLLRIAEENQDGPDPSVFTDSFKEMLDQFDITSEGRSIFDFSARPPEDADGRLLLPSDSPTGGDIQEFLLNVVLPEISGAIEENLENIDASFSLVITREELDRFGISDEGPVEMDFGDVKILEAVLRAVKGTLLSTLLAYDVNINIGELELDLDIDEPRLDDVQIQREIIDTHPTLLTLKDRDSADLLAQAKASVKAALDTYFVASDFIRNRDDADQSDDAITIEPEDLADEEELRRLLGETLCSLDGTAFLALTDTGVLCETAGVPTIDEEQVNLSRFFDTPFDLRDILPPFAFNAACGGNFIDTTMPTSTFPFPDPTFNGVLPNRTQAGLIDFLDLAPNIEVFSFDTPFVPPRGSDRQVSSVFIHSDNANSLVPPVEIENIAFQDGTAFNLDPMLTDADFPKAFCQEDDHLSFDVIFSPPTSGSFTDTLIIQSNDPDEPIQNVFVEAETLLSPRCRELLVGDTCGTSTSGICISLRLPDDSSCRGNCAESVAADLRAEGIDITGPTGFFASPDCTALVGFRPDIEGTEEGAQCLVDFLGPPYEIDPTTGGCTADGFPYQINLE